MLSAPWQHGEGGEAPPGRYFLAGFSAAFFPSSDRLHVEFPFGLDEDDALGAGVAPRRVSLYVEGMNS